MKYISEKKNKRERNQLYTKRSKIYMWTLRHLNVTHTDTQITHFVMHINMRYISNWCHHQTNNRSKMLPIDQFMLNLNSFFSWKQKLAAYKNIQQDGSINSEFRSLEKEMLNDWKSTFNLEKLFYPEIISFRFQKKTSSNFGPSFTLISMWDERFDLIAAAVWYLMLLLLLCARCVVHIANCSRR